MSQTTGLKGVPRNQTDVRVVERYIDKGKIKAADYEAHLKSLPDDTANAVWVELDVHDAELAESLSAGESEDSDSSSSDTDLT